jgi:hypothetical protein
MEELSEAEVSALRIKLKEHFELRLALLESLINVKLDALETKVQTANRVAEEKVSTANTEMKLHLGTMNEWRSTVTDILATMVTKAELNVWKDKIEEALGQFRDFKVAMDSKASTRSLLFSNLATAISLLVAMVSLIITLSQIFAGK